MRSVVLGVGNVLLADDGAGVHAARHMQGALHDREDVVVIDGGTLSFTLAPDIENADRLIVLDAAQLHAPPGTVHAFFGLDMDRFLGRPKLSVHEVSLLDLLDIARLTSGIPPQRALLAIQPQKIDWGEELTDPVSRGVTQAVALALALIEDWPAQSWATQAAACAVASAP